MTHINLIEDVTRSSYNMRKTIFFQKGLTSILVIWVLLCILPGDCFLLGCGEEDLLYQCAEEETIVSSYANGDFPIAIGDSHCTNCCLLCSHNIVMDLCQFSPILLIIQSRRFKAVHFNHFKNTLSAIIYHPPRLTI